MNSVLTILIVEDEPIVGKIALRHIRDQGHIPLGPVPSYDRALEVLNQRTPALALIDLHLQGEESGLDVGQWMNDHIPHVPHAYLTGEEDPKVLAAARRSNPIALLFKTLHPASLRASIDVIISNFEPRPVPESTLPVQDGQVTRLVSASQILYAQTEHVYINLVLDDGSSLLHRGSMQDLIAQLRSADMVQTHRRYLVNAGKITALDTGNVYLGEHRVPMSRRRRTELKRQLAARLNL